MFLRSMMGNFSVVFAHFVMYVNGLPNFLSQLLSSMSNLAFLQSEKKWLQGSVCVVPDRTPGQNGTNHRLDHLGHLFDVVSDGVAYWSGQTIFVVKRARHHFLSSFGLQAGNLLVNPFSPSLKPAESFVAGGRCLGGPGR